MNKRGYMPSFPNVQPAIAQMSGHPFSKFSAEIRAMGSATYPLHIGDTYLTPIEGARMQDVNLQSHPNAHKYTSPKGYPALVQSCSEAYDVDPERIQVTPGATGGLHLLAMSFLAPGDEVLVLAPYWPLTIGIIRAAGAIPISVPFYDQSQSVAERISPYVTDKTVAIYVNSPNNPTGLLMPPEDVRELAQMAREYNFWIFSDEVYERLLFQGTHLPIRMEAPERTISMFSFSKAYAMAGYRCGFLLLPSVELAKIANKTAVNSFYSVSTPAQIAACVALKNGDAWLENVRHTYQKTGKECADILGVPAPQAGTFLFFDIADKLAGRGMDAFLLSCIAHKLLLAPGASFGVGYESYIRVCFTSVEPDLVLEGMGILKSLLG
jgi:N-succinyldiaminopimelate aminotransferase